MEIIISNRSSQPIYEQIVQQVKQQVIEGTLPPGTVIPSMRALAQQLHISVITVQKAYELLAADRFIETVQGKGTFVAGASLDFIREEHLKQVEKHLEAAVRLARANGIGQAKLHEVVDIFYKEEENA